MMLQSYSWAYMWEKNYNLKRYMHLMFIAALFIIARIWKQPRCPLTDELIKKLWYIYTMENYSAIKMNGFESILVSYNECRAFYAE